MKHYSKYFNIACGLLTMTIIACSPISGRDFNVASLHNQQQYCKAQKLKKHLYDQEFDARCKDFVAAQNNTKRKYFDGGCDLITDIRCLAGELV